MKKTLLILIILCSSFSFSQNRITIDYDFVDKGLTYDNYECKLQIQNHKSISFVNYEKKEFKNINEETNEVFVGGAFMNRYFIVDKKTNKLNVFCNESGKKYNIEEEIPTFQWNIDYTEEIILENFKCKKATMSFRGRTYEAWYTEEIPASFGPWKFSGLPGLILYIYDTNLTYVWRAKKIKFKDTELKLPKNYANFIPISLKDFMQVIEDSIQQMRKRAFANAGRNVTISIPDKKDNPRKSVEIIYEWEEE